MKVVFSSKVENPTLELEPVFGSAKAYLVIDTNTKEYDVLQNKPKRGEDCHMCQAFVELKVDTIVSCELCKHCMANLQNLGIDLWKCDGSVNIRESFNKLVIGGIFERSKPDIGEDCLHSKMMNS